MPLLAANAAQVEDIARLEAAPRELIARFWPGPLTLLLPVRDACCAQIEARRLPAPLINAAGKVAIRVTPHPLAARLARLAGGRAHGQRANLSGRDPVCDPKNLDSELLAALADLGDLGGLLLAGREAEPAGGAPSTLVEPLPNAGEAAKNASVCCGPEQSARKPWRGRALRAFRRAAGPRPAPCPRDCCFCQQPSMRTHALRLRCRMRSGVLRSSRAGIEWSAANLSRPLPHVRNA